MLKTIESRSKTHGIELYPDCLEHYTLISDLQNCKFPYDYGYAMILHDMDKFTDDVNGHKKGELKKAHYHVIFALPRECTKSAFIKRIQEIYPGVKENYYYHETREHGIRYLVHADDPNKFQYNPDLIISHNLDYSKYLERQFVADEEDKIIHILDHINSYPKESRDEFTRWILKSGYWSEYRRSYSIINDIIKERKERMTYAVADEVIKTKRNIIQQVNDLRDELRNVRKDVSKLNNDRVMYLRTLKPDYELPF